MKKLLLASAALAVLSFGGQAQAADMKVSAVAPPPFSWTGCYAGVNAGYKWGYSKHSYAGLGGGLSNTTVAVGTDLTPDFRVNGQIYGVQGGCNMQFSRWVAGVEVDYDFSAASGQTTTDTAVVPRVNANQIFHTDQRRLATARGRVGMTMDKFLFYVTGGAAWGTFDLSNNLPVNINPFAQQDPTRTTKTGWVVGAGLDYALLGGWSARAEFLYVDFGSGLHYGDFPIPCTPPVFPAVGGQGTGCPNADVRMREYIGRVGLSYKFF